MSIWEKAQTVQLKVSDNIQPGFSIGFDKRIEPETKTELCEFVSWVESKYRQPVTLWVDFEYRHYLIRRDGKRVGFLFYWSDFTDYPVFANPDDIPLIRLPVRTERSSIDDILGSFIEAISMYYAWICNEIQDYQQNDDDVDRILEDYIDHRKSQAAADKQVRQ